MRAARTTRAVRALLLSPMDDEERKGRPATGLMAASRDERKDALDAWRRYLELLVHRQRAQQNVVAMRARRVAPMRDPDNQLRSDVRHIL
jgi:hypothetical protein